MSSPHGTGRDGPVDPDETAETADQVTEVIDIGDPGDDEAVTGQRRFTAPGFDAGSTQIIDRVPDAPTEFIVSPATSPAQSQAPYRRGAGPRAIPRRAGARRRWLAPTMLMVLAFVAAAVVGTLLFRHSSAARASQQDKVRSTIQTFDNAIQNGDLATLRSITCGQTRDNYIDYDDRSWADTYSKVLAARQYPVVASIDEVVVNGDHAEANVTSYMAYDPAMRSTRSFDLQFRDDRWKICQSS